MTLASAAPRLSRLRTNTSEQGARLSLRALGLKCPHLFLSFKPGHDGSIAHIQVRQLRFSFEAEKDSNPRYALAVVPSLPDVVCLSGWSKGFYFPEPSIGAGYYGCDESGVQITEQSFLGKRIPLFSSTHERSHLLCGYGSR